MDSFCQQIKLLLSGLLRLWLSLLVGLLLLLAILQLTVLAPVVFFRLVQTASKTVLCSVVFISPILTCYYCFLSPPHECRVFEGRSFFGSWRISSPRTHNWHFIINCDWNEWMNEGEHQSPGLCILALSPRRATWLFRLCPPTLGSRAGCLRPEPTRTSEVLPASRAAAARGSRG